MITEMRIAKLIKHAYETANFDELFLIMTNDYEHLSFWMADVVRGEENAIDYYQNKGIAIIKSNSPINGTLVKILKAPSSARPHGIFKKGIKCDEDSSFLSRIDQGKISVLMEQTIDGENIRTLAIPTVTENGMLSQILVTNPDFYTFESLDDNANNFKREKLIEQLRNIQFCAIPTVITMDMGLEYDFITTEGAGTSLGTIGEWPAYKFCRIENEKWATIKKKAADGFLVPDDFIGTELEYLTNNMRRYHQDYYDDFANTFSNLKNLPDLLPDYFYCIFDIKSWDDKHKPEFYSDVDLLLKDFQKEYCWCITEWDEMDNDDLQNWLDRTYDDLSGFPFMVCSDEAQEENEEDE